MRTHEALVAAAIAIFPTASDAAGDPIVEQARYYPATCVARHGEAAADYSADLLIDATREGYIRNARLVSATDPCVEESAIAFARAYRLNGKSWAASARADSRPLKVVFDRARSPRIRPSTIVTPAYPDGCHFYSRWMQDYRVRFSIATDGAPKDIEFTTPADTCVEPSIRRALEGWRFTAEESLAWTDQVVVRFIYEDWDDSEESPVDQWTRRSVDEFYGEVADLIVNRKESAVALQRLATFEREQAAKLRRAELIRFHLLRAAARLETSDLAGALDDLHASNQAVLKVREPLAPQDVVPALEKAFGVADVSVRMINSVRVSPLDRITTPRQTN